jgi:hypothetical protein
MTTNEQIHAMLTAGEARVEAAAAAIDTDVHTLMDKLKTIYEKFYGVIAADIHDWHWQATALKNHLAAEETPHDAAPDLPHATPADAPDPAPSGAGAAPASPASAEPPAEPVAADPPADPAP